MTRTRYEILLARYRTMMTESGAFPTDITDAELVAKLKPKTHEGQMKALEDLTSLVSDRFWQARGL